MNTRKHTHKHTHKYTHVTTIKKEDIKKVKKKLSQKKRFVRKFPLSSLHLVFVQRLKVWSNTY